MNNQYSYTGAELDLFSTAVHWKKYFSGYIAPYIKGNVLEVGAGKGNTTPFVSALPAIASWTFLEPDEKFCSILLQQVKEHKNSANKTVKQGTIFSLSETDNFDTILYIDVLEHIERDQQEIEKAARMLAPNGHLIVLSPAHPFLYSRFDKAIGHYRRYNKESLRAVASAARLREISMLYLDSSGYFLSLGNRLLMKQSYPTKTQIDIWDKFIVKMSKVTDPLLMHRFGKTIVGVWEKA